MRRIAVFFVAATLTAIAGCGQPIPVDTIEAGDDNPFSEVWGECRYEIVVVPVTDVSLEAKILPVGATITLEALDALSGRRGNWLPVSQGRFS